MRYFFINTDAVSLGGASPHDKWFKYGYAFSGGPKSYGFKLGRMVPGDICLMYANKIGVVGIGNVVEPWDGRTYSNPLVYKEPFRDLEYRIIRWTHLSRQFLGMSFKLQKCTVFMNLKLKSALLIY